MKAKFLVGIVLASVLLVGCKKEKSVDELEVVTPKEVEVVKVTLDVIAKKDDTFSLFYSQDRTANFTEEPIWMDVKGSDQPQQITYSLPADVYPLQLRLDFGMNKDQEDIVLKTVNVSYKGKTFTTSGADVWNYFRADDTKCTVDATSGTIKAVVKDGVRQYPSLYPHEATLGEKLASLGK